MGNSAALFCVIFAAGQPTPAAPVPAPAQVLAGLKAYYKGISGLPALTVGYAIKHDHLAGANRYSFRDAQLVNVSRGGAYRTEIRYRTKAADPKSPPVVRVCTWDGKVGMSIVDTPTTVSLNPIPDTIIFYYRYYFNYLGSAEGDALISRYFDGVPVPNPESILALGIDKHGREYTVRPAPEEVDGRSCVVLERPGHDRVWVDPERGYMPRKLELLVPGTAQVRERLLFDREQQVGAVWLPKQISRDQYGGLDEDKALQSKVTNRYLLTVSDLSDRPVSDGTFSLEVKEGMTVQDKFRGMNYQKHGAGTNTLTSTLDEAQRTIPERRTNVYLVVVLCGLVLVCLLLGRVLKRKIAESPS